MFFKSTKILLIFFIIISSNSCGLLKENNREIKYKTTDFDKHPKPKSPTYLNLDDWLVHPSKNSELEFLDKNNGLMKVDIFLLFQHCLPIEKTLTGTQIYTTIILLMF